MCKGASSGRILRMTEIDGDRRFFCVVEWVEPLTLLRTPSLKYGQQLIETLFQMENNSDFDEIICNDRRCNTYFLFVCLLCVSASEQQTDDRITCVGILKP